MRTPQERSCRSVTPVPHSDVRTSPLAPRRPRTAQVRNKSTFGRQQRSVGEHCVGSQLGSSEERRRDISAAHFFNPQYRSDLPQQAICHSRTL